MSKRFLLKYKGCPTPLVASGSKPASKINWALCVICQQDRNETLTDPMLTKRKDPGSAYSTLAESLLKMNELNELPDSMQLQNLDEGEGIEAAMVVNKARWHQSCRLLFNKTQVQRAECRALKKSISTQDADVIAGPNSTNDDDAGPSKRTRRHSTCTANIAQEALCFFCYNPAGADGLHEVETFQLDSRVRTCAELLQDTELLSRLSTGDMIALKAKYHNKCLASLYNRARRHKDEEKRGSDKETVISGIAFAEIVMYIEEARLDDSTTPVFKLTDLVKLYSSRMEQLGIKLDNKVHSTRLKERLMAHIPHLQAQTQGMDVLLAFSDDISAALSKACEWDSDNDAVHLAHAAKIVRRHMFDDQKPFIGFQEGCQRDCWCW